METLFGLVGQISVWWYVLIALILTHITIVSVTLYLHRSKTHGSVDFHPGVQHFFRFWLWLTTGMKTHEWVAVHRKHHANCETVDDPHSPQQLGIMKLLTHGARLYKEALKQDDILSYVQGKYAAGLPDDWVERNLYSKHPWLGLVILGVLQTLILGLPGLIIFGIQAYWIPIWAAGVINGIGHYWGYRNTETPDASRNIFPLGILIGGEELHNNHHAYQTSPKTSLKKWEVDIGWGYICLLKDLGLAEVNEKKLAKLPVSLSGVCVLGGEEWMRLFKRHLFFIKAKFNKAVAEADVHTELVEHFSYWLEHPEEATYFELGVWVTKALYEHDDNEIGGFALWFWQLHEVDEPGR